MGYSPFVVGSPIAICDNGKILYAVLIDNKTNKFTYMYVDRECKEAKTKFITRVRTKYKIVKRNRYSVFTTITEDYVFGIEAKYLREALMEYKYRLVQAL